MMENNCEMCQVKIAQITDSISADLLRVLGFEVVQNFGGGYYARDTMYRSCTTKLAEAYAHGYRGDEAAMFAIRLQADRNAAQSLETARQKVAEIELAAAHENAKAEAIAFNHFKARSK